MAPWAARLPLHAGAALARSLVRPEGSQSNRTCLEPKWLRKELYIYIHIYIGGAVRRGRPICFISETTRTPQKSPEPTRTHRNSPECNRIQQDSPEPTRTHHNQPELANPPERTRTHNPPEFARTRQNFPVATTNHTSRTHQNPLDPTRTHQSQPEPTSAL